MSKCRFNGRFGRLALERRKSSMSSSPVSARTNLLNVATGIDQAMDGAAFVGGEKEKLAVACLELSIEHQAAILRLGTDGVYGSMFALLRPMTESYVRGTWLFRCADDKGIKDFKKAKLKKFADLLADIQAARTNIPAPPIKAFVDGFHDFTHTGINQVLRRSIAGGRYPDDDLIKAYSLASTFGLFAALELACLATDHQDRVVRVGECIQNFLAIEAQAGRTSTN